MNHVLPALRYFLFMTVLVGLIYPLFVTAVGKIAFRSQANGSLLERDGKIIGSSLLAQKFESERYFWSRPSAVDYNPLSSGGSNLGPTSAALKDAFLKQEQKLGSTAPQDLLFASASGLDPHISPESALFQISRIAKARGMSEDSVQDLVARFIENRQLGFLGERRINVLKLNLALDEKR